MRQTETAAKRQSESSPPVVIPPIAEQEGLTPAELRGLADATGKKIHLHNSDPYIYGWEKTECGRRVQPGMLITVHGVDAATCESCRNVYDFGNLRGAC